MAIYQEIVLLETALNEATEDLGLPCNFRTLEGRMNFLRQYGTVYHYRSCLCSPHLSYDTFDSPEGSVCSWSALLSIVTGLPDPRSSLNAFPINSLLCHSPDGIDLQQREYDIFGGFSGCTKVLLLIAFKLGMYFLIFKLYLFLDKSKNSH